MSALLALALTCQLNTMQPDYYTATLNGPNSKNKYSFVLYSHYYGAKFDYRYSLTRLGEVLSGQDKRKDDVTVSKIEDQGSGRVTLEINSKKESLLKMNCTAE